MGTTGQLLEPASHLARAISRWNITAENRGVEENAGDRLTCEPDLCSGDERAV